MVVGLEGVKGGLERAAQTVLTQLQSNLGRELRNRTPIDTGRARRGWRDFDNREVLDSSPSTVQAAGRPFRRDDLGLTNQVPYIALLEKGRSRQAPNGFVNQSISAAIRQTEVDFAIKAPK